MKKLLLACSLAVVLVQGLWAQSEVEKKVKLKLWGQAPDEFKTTQVPEKWKNESAVMLAFQREYICDFTTKVTGIASVNRFYIEQINIHYRIKLLDKAAVADYSEISFNNKTIKTNLFGKASAYRILGIKVIKAAGTEKEVDLKDAVKSDAGSGNDLKIPIPNLEPGDIVDYFIALRDESMTMPDFGDEQLLESKYPIVKQTITFMLPHQMNFYNTPYNGAPDFKKEVKDNDVLYTLKDEMRDKAPRLIWNYPYLTAPHFRYRISKEEKKPDAEQGARDLMKYFAYNNSDIGYLVDFMDVNFKKDKSSRKAIEELYFLLRNPIYKQAYFDIKQGEPLDNGYTPDRFFFLVSRYCTKYDIPHEVLLIPSREYGPFPDLVNYGSCDLIMKINIKPTLYLKRPTPFALPGDVPYGFEGMEGVAQYTSVKDNIPPVTTADQNNTSANIDLTLDADDNTKLNVKRNIKAIGHSKVYHQYLVVTDYDYIKEYDQPKYMVERSRLLRDLIKDYNKEKAKFEQRLTQDYTARDERIKSELEDDMEVKIADYKNLTVKSAGMWQESPTVDYSDEFSAENLTKRAGPNIIVELGKAIEKQTDLKEEQKTRTRDVFMDFARSFNHTITFTIPEGYTVEGLDNFTRKTESDAGGFVSSATSDGKKVVINVRKYYTKNHYAATDWPKVNAFLQTAVDFYGTKLLLKKS
ncbi:DUF3857 domain-containing protein [Chryseolinea lacunae]|uniref:DUF3857 domain-containing protein n=1 Tax=Chryseolinea lacunae TaxID=2801331 RepID=A0ABS1KY59_9BACT|nr:DUF3857 domain-containing protein [Chryseolinea lacunae]MBL0744385.1 DUF3857 domain-containing protein [Chryseolinea lacunae]